MLPRRNYKMKPPISVRFNPGHSVAKDIAAYYLMRAGSGVKVFDVTGHGHDATFVNEPVWCSSKYGRALDFGGTDEHLACGVIPLGGNTGSILAWAKSDTDIGVHKVVGRNWQHHSLGFSGAAVQGYWNNQLIAGAIPASSILKWHLFAVTYDGNLAADNLKLWLDGVLLQKADLLGATTNEDQAWEIASHGNNANYWDGEIGSVMLSKRVIYSSEMTLLSRRLFCMFGSGQRYAML